MTLWVLHNLCEVLVLLYSKKDKSPALLLGNGGPVGFWADL